MKKGGYKTLKIISILTAILALIILTALYTNIDKSVNSFFTTIQSQSITTIALQISDLSSEVYIIFLSLILLLILYKKQEINEIAFYLSNIIAGIALTFILKNTIQRARPENTLETGFSFPSGHALESTMLYGSLAIMFWNKNRKVSYICIALPIIISLSRLYLGVHWLTDVLAGLAIGALWLRLSYLVALKK